MKLLPLLPAFALLLPVLSYTAAAVDYSRPAGTEAPTDAASPGAADSTLTEAGHDPDSPQGVWDELVEQVPDIGLYTYFSYTQVREDVPRPEELPPVRQICREIPVRGSRMTQTVCHNPMDQMDASEMARIRALMWHAGQGTCDQGVAQRGQSASCMVYQRLVINPSVDP